MGTSKSAAELASKIGKLSAECEKIPQSVVGDAALIVKKNILGLTPARLSGVGKRGAKLGVRYNLGTFGGVAKAKVYATGPFQLIERDTRAHRIPRERQRGRKRYAVIPGVGVRAYAEHPGTTGKHPFERGVGISLPFMSRLLSKEAADAVRHSF